MIDTKKVTDRRGLRLEALAEAVADAEALAAAESEGRLQAVGNWTLGQAISHVAFWANAPFDGYPDIPAPPLPMRLMLKLMKGRMLRNGMPAGVTIPDVPGGTLGAEEISAGEAVSRLRPAFERLERECPAVPNPLFGRMTHEEWKKLNLRHAELHQSFFSVVRH